MGDVWRLLLTLCVALAVTSCGASTDDVEEWVKKDLQSYVSTDRDLARYYITVTDVSLVEAGDNEYKGIATVRTARRGDEHKIPLAVTYDGGEGIWQAERGAFLFLMDEPGGTSP